MTSGPICRAELTASWASLERFSGLGFPGSPVPCRSSRCDQEPHVLLTAAAGGPSSAALCWTEAGMTRGVCGCVRSPSLKMQGETRAQRTRGHSRGGALFTRNVPVGVSNLMNKPSRCAKRPEVVGGRGGDKDLMLFDVRSYCFQKGFLS